MLMLSSAASSTVIFFACVLRTSSLRRRNSRCAFRTRARRCCKREVRKILGSKEDNHSTPRAVSSSAVSLIGRPRRFFLRSSMASIRLDKWYAWDCNLGHPVWYRVQTRNDRRPYGNSASNAQTFVRKRAPALLHLFVKTYCSM